MAVIAIVYLLWRTAATGTSALRTMAGCDLQAKISRNSEPLENALAHVKPLLRRLPFSRHFLSPDDRDLYVI